MFSITDDGVAAPRPGARVAAVGLAARVPLDSIVLPANSDSSFVPSGLPKPVHGSHQGPALYAPFPPETTSRQSGSRGWE